MASFIDVPDELVLEIVSYLGDPADSLHLALSHPRFYSIGQKSFYTSATFPAPNCKYSNVLHFFRTILDRPDLANAVQRLTLVTVDRTVQHDAACEDHCSCILGPVQKQAKTKARQSGVGGSKWRSLLRHAYEPAFAGVVLTLLPNLTELHIQHFSCSISEGELEITSPKGGIRLKKLFGHRSSALQAANIPQWPNLETLTTSAAIEYPLLEQPRLRHLDICIDSCLKIKQRCEVLPSIKVLTVRYSPMISLDMEKPSVSDKRRFLVNLTSKLPHLRHMNIYLKPWNENDSGRYHDYGVLQWTQILEFVGGTWNTLHTLVIRRSTPPDPKTQDPVLWYLRFGLGTSLTRFLALRRLVFESFCIPVDERFFTRRFLPEYLESFEVINPSDQCQDWPTRLVKSKRNGYLQDLNRVVIHGAKDSWYQSQFGVDEVWAYVRKMGIKTQSGVSYDDDATTV